MSAAYTMSGMFPIQVEKDWINSWLWQPVPIHSVDQNIDYILAMTKPCPLYDQTIEKYKNSPEIKSILEKNHSLMQYLENNTGRRIRTFGSVVFVYDVLSIEKRRNFT